MDTIVIVGLLFSFYILYTCYPIYYILFKLNTYKSFSIFFRFTYTIPSIIVGPIFGILEFCLHILEPNYNTRFYIMFNFYYIVGNMSLLNYVYRGLNIYLNKNKEKNKIKYIRNLFIAIYLFGIIYTLVIDLLFYHKIIKPNEYFLLYHYFVILFGLTLHLKIIFELNKIKNNIKYDYLFSFIFITATNVVSLLYPKSLFSMYKITISTFLSYIPYIIIPLVLFWIDIYNEDNKYADSELVNNKIINVTNIEKISEIKKEEIKNIYIQIYEDIKDRYTNK